MSYLEELEKELELFLEEYKGFSSDQQLSNRASHVRNQITKLRVETNKLKYPERYFGLEVKTGRE